MCRVVLFNAARFFLKKLRFSEQKKRKSALITDP